MMQAYLIIFLVIVLVNLQYVNVAKCQWCKRIPMQNAMVQNVNGTNILIDIDFSTT